jgi:hypothetical protein
MSQHTAFAVPKDRQDVTVVLFQGGSTDGAIFLEYQPGELSVHNRITAFLEDGNTFFPLVLKGGGTEFIHKKNIKLIKVAYHPDQDSVQSLSLMHTVNITAVFIDESTISGALMAEVPVEKARLSDCLNLPAKFLSVKIDGRICYINKNALRKVVYASAKK